MGRQHPLITQNVDQNSPSSFLTQEKAYKTTLKKTYHRRDSFVISYIVHNILIFIAQLIF